MEFVYGWHGQVFLAMGTKIMLLKKIILLSIIIVLMATAHSSAAMQHSNAADKSEPLKAPPPKNAVADSTVYVTAHADEEINDPNELLPEQKVALQSESRPTPAPATDTATKPWLRCYHPQVTDRTFNVLCYPYYQGGKSYPMSEVLSVPIPSEDTLRIDPNQIDPNQIDPNQIDSDPKLETIHNILETYCDLIHQWRNINESAGATLEVVRSIELTRRATGIYHVNAKLAIDVKRTLGRIGRLNRQFDLTSRLAMQKLLRRHSDKLMTARLEKYVHELQALFELLCEQNDAITVALGIGKINRQAQRANQAPIYYTNLGLPNVPSELYKQQ